MSLSSLYRTYVQSVKNKLILNVILIHAVLVGFVVFDLISREHDFMEEQLSNRGYELTSLLASTVSVPLLNNDLVALDELLTDVDKIRGHYMVFIVDKHGVVRGTTMKKYFNLQLDDEISKRGIQKLLDSNINQYQIRHDHLIDTINTVKVEGQIVGYVRTILDESFMEEEMHIMTTKGFVYVLLAILLGTYFAWLTVRRLTIKLKLMAEAAERVRQKDFDIELPLTGSNDELSKMMKAFNVMSKSISEYTNELKESEAELLEAQAISHIGSWEIDLKTSKVQWSPELYKIYERDPISYEPSLENEAHLWSKEDNIAITNTIAKSIETGKRTELEHKILLEDGRTKYVFATGIAVYNKEGEATSIKGVTQDITQHTLDQQNIKAKENQLLVQSRLAQMGEMISMIAHQWRQPLSAISATAMNLKVMIELENHDLSTPEGLEACKKDQLVHLDDIENYVQSLSSTINDFKNFYKADKNSVSVSLDEIVQKALGIIKSSLQNDKIELIYDPQAKECIDVLDGEMMQVILNIMKNAQDNFKDKEIANPRIDIITTDRSVKICDNGGGVDPAMVEKIYDPYFSTKTEKNGTGLGLYMSKIIIEDHHKGRLKVENVNDGACFSIEL